MSSKICTHAENCGILSVMKIAELLKAWRHHHMMTIEEASRRIGVSWDIYRRVEKGEEMSLKTFLKIMEWILSG